MIEHRALIGVETDPRVTREASDGSVKMVIRFARLIELIVGFYREQSFQHITRKQYYALTCRGDDLLRGELIDTYWPSTVQFMHCMARRQLLREGKLEWSVTHEVIHLPPNFSKLTSDEIVETLLWYAECSSAEERELIMEFLLTDGLCGGSYREFNEKNWRIQELLTQISNSAVGQEFLREDSV